MLNPAWCSSVGKWPTGIQRRLHGQCNKLETLLYGSIDLVLAFDEIALRTGSKIFLFHLKGTDFSLCRSQLSFQLVDFKLRGIVTVWT